MYKKWYLIDNAINHLNIIIAILTFLIACTNSMILIYCFLFVSCVYILMNGLSVINTTFTSLRGFLKYGIIIEFFLSFIIMAAFREILIINHNIDDTTMTIIILVSPIITWLFLSLIVNNEVAKVTNLILASFFGILVYFKDLVSNYITMEYTRLYVNMHKTCYKSLFNIFLIFY